MEYLFTVVIPKIRYAITTCIGVVIIAIFMWKDAIHGKSINYVYFKTSAVILGILIALLIVLLLFTILFFQFKLTVCCLLMSGILFGIGKINQFVLLDKLMDASFLWTVLAICLNFCFLILVSQVLIRTNILEFISNETKGDYNELSISKKSSKHNELSI